MHEKAFNSIIFIEIEQNASSESDEDDDGDEEEDENYHGDLDFPDEEFQSGNFLDFLAEAEEAHANEFADMPVDRQDSSAWEEENEMDEVAFEQYVEQNFDFGNIRDLYPHLSPPARVRVPLVSP